MVRMKRLIAGFLCMVMLFTAVPLEAFASDTGSETPALESVMESQESIPVEGASEPEPTQTEAAPTETEAAPAEITEEETAPTENTQEETEPTQEETVPTEEETDPAEEETEPSQEEDGEEPRWLYSVNGSGYAVIEGYTDDGVTELSIPYSIDGYYVVAIGEQAFVNNTALSAVYIHGNVMSIAANAFEGLSPVLSGYHGTYVMAYASQKGFAFHVRANQSALAEGVIDYSYVQGGRYSFTDGSTVIMSLPEALLLSVGGQFYIPQAYDGLPGVYEVLSIETNGGSAVLSVKNTAAGEVTEEVTEPTEEVTEEVTEPTEVTEEVTEEETEPTEEENGEEPRWLYSVNDQGYAVIEGYTDHSVEELSIPYSIDGYYVVAIGEKAFVDNTALSKMYVHGNVLSIAPDAFEGLGLTLSGYNGTTVAAYADDYGYSFRLRADQSYFTFRENVIDYSYVPSSRYSFLEGTTMKMSMPEALQLSTGSLIFLPYGHNGTMEVYEVLSIENQDTDAIVSLRKASYEDTLNSFKVSQEKMYPDWSNAKWEEGVVITEEKGSDEYFYDTFGLDYSVQLGEMKVSWPGSKGGKELGTASAELFATGYIELIGTADIDIDMSPFSSRINEMSVTLSPSIYIKGGIRFGVENSHTKMEMVTPRDYTYKLGSIPLVTASGVVSVNVGLYLKVSASGEITITFSGGGKVGFQWNKNLNKYEAVNQWKWNDPTLDGMLTLEIGPAFAVELHALIIGKVASAELFLGVRFRVKSSLHFNLESIIEGICSDITAEVKISLSISMDAKIIKKIMEKFLIRDTRIELISMYFPVFKRHYEYRPGKGISSSVETCTYESMRNVQFCTFISQTIDDLQVYHEAKISEPTLTEIPGNKLLGWYTDENYTKQWDFKKDKVTSNMTLYAKWEKSTKTVAFITQDEAVGAASWTDQYAPGSYITQPAVKLRNWKLNGWYLDPEFTDAWDFEKDIMPDEDLTLYASWTYDESEDPDQPTGTPDKNYTIEGGKLYFNGHVYQHIPIYKLFSAARADAESRGGYLVTISSQEEMDAVLDYVQDDCAQNTLWLGINSTTDWKYWLTGEKMEYWNGGDPVTSSSQFNGLFYRANGKWDTYDNSTTSHYIIEWGSYVVDPGFTEYASSGNVQYSISANGTSAIVVGFAKGEEANISNIYHGMLVTEIAAKAFQGNTTVKKVTIPSTVEKIGDYAFADCTMLEEIHIPESVTSIGAHAFDGCTALKKVTLPRGCTVLPEYLFQNCTSLKEILNTEALATIQQGTFKGCTGLERFTVPQGLTAIGNNAFYGCTSLKELVLNSELQTIGSGAFYGCESLSGSITIPAKCTRVNSNAFYGCSALEHIFLLCDQAALVSDPFRNVNGVFHGKVEDGIDTWCTRNGKTFVSIDGTYRVRFYPGEVTDPATEEATKDLYLPSGAIIPEPSIYKAGYILEGWYMDPGFVSKWDFARDRVKYENVSLYAKWLEESQVFTYYVQGGNAYLTEYNGRDSHVTIPSTLGGYRVVGIAADVFAEKDFIKSISLPASISVIAPNAFVDCLSLYSITFPQGNAHFTFKNGVLYSADMKELIYVAEGRTFVKFVVPDGVQRIYAGAFKNQSELSVVEIPESVVSIGELAFPMNFFLTLYGPNYHSAPMVYAEEYGIGYNEYVATFYDGDQVLFSAIIPAGNLLAEYSGYVSEYATYAGWYRDKEFTKAWNFETDKMPASDLSLYLKWDSDFAVAEESAGLIITKYVGTRSEIIIPEEINGTPVIGIGANAFVNTWDSPITSILIPDCVSKFANNGISGNPAPTVIANLDSPAAAYAKRAGLTLQARTYTITFEVNGGREISPASCVAGEIPQLPTPLKSNAYFLGWYTTSYYSTMWTDTDVMPKENITLYARWEVINSQFTNDLTYEVTGENTIAITSYYGSKIVLSIPSSINGYVVTAIGDFAFSQNKTLLSVSIPDTVQHLGEFAFANSSVMTISGGKGIVSMGESCFSGASALRTPFIPEGVEEIPNYCFEYCDAFTDVSIPETVTAIGNYAFYGCDFLRSAEVPESVTKFGTGVFASCKNLQTVNLPSTLSNIDVSDYGSAVVHFYPTKRLSILSIKQLTKSSVQIDWNEVAQADGYKLYRRQGTMGQYQLVKTVTGTDTANYNLIPGVTYYYKLAAYQTKGSSTVTLAESDEHRIRITRLSTPAISHVQALSKDTAKMQWTSVVGAEGYEIWRVYQLSGEYQYLKTVTGTQTVNTGLLGGRSYFYKIRAFYQDGDEVEYSDFSDVYAFTMPLNFLGVPQNVSVRQTAAGTVLISWDAVEDADGYNVYRKRGNGTLSLVKTTADTSAYNYNLVLGQTYGYAVEAFCSTGKGTLTGQKSGVVEVSIEGLATPQIKSVTQSAVKTALVSWTSVSAADGYELWRSRTENGTYSLMKTVTGTATSNYNLSIGGTYFYKVRAYTVDSSNQYQYSAYSKAVSITILSVAKTRLKSVVQDGTNAAKITWAYMSGAKSYEVWRSINDKEHYELVRTTTGTAVLDRNLIDGQTYYYKVRAYDDSGETIIYGDFSDALSLRIIGTPVIAALEQSGSNAVYIAWDRVTDVSGYELWRSTDGRSYTKVKNVETASTSNYNLTAGGTYYYMLRAYRLVGETKTYGSFSKAAAVKILGTPNVTSLLQNGSNGVTLKWSKDEYADGYELWRTRTEDHGVFSKVKNVTGTSTTSFGLGETVVTYKLRSYAVVNGVKVYGLFGDAQSITILGTPTFKEGVQASTNAAFLSWNAVDGATSYKVYRSTSPDGVFGLIKSVTDTETTTYSLQSGKTYYFKIKAVTKENGITHESAYSQAIAVYVSSVVAPSIKALAQTDDRITITAAFKGTVEGVELWQSTNSGAYSKVAESTTETLSDIPCDSYKTYAFKLRAYVTVGGTRVYSAFSSVVKLGTLETPRMNVLSQIDTAKVYLEWQPVAGAQRYEISRGISGSQSFTTLGSVEGCSYTDTVNEDGTYVYRIRACGSENGETLYSRWSSNTVTAATYSDNVYPETAHDYANDQNQIYTYTKKGAKALKLTFSAASKTESGYDFVYVMDGNGYCVAKLSGEFGGTTLVTAGDSFQLYFTANWSGAYYGFSFDSIVAAPLDEAAAPLYSWRISGNRLLADGSCDFSAIANRAVFHHLTELEVVSGTTSVKANLLSGLTTIRKVILPNGLVTIENQAFCNCTNLEEITLPDTVTSIGAHAFESCTGLKAVKLPKNLKQIGEYAFRNCAGLEAITLPKEITSIPAYAFDGCTNLKECPLPEKITSIGSHAFDGTALSKVTIPSSVTEISAYAFSKCTELRELNLPKGLTTIGDYAFSGCTSLKEALLSENVASIGSNAFANCTALQEIKLPAQLKSISSHAFMNCTGLTKVTIPATFGSVSLPTYTGSAVFYGCTALTEIAFEEGITKIPAYAFVGMYIPEITIPDTVTEIGNYAFYDCTKLRKVNLPKNVTSIGNYVFYGCSSLEEAPLGEQITSIGSFAFAGCTALQEIKLPAQLKSISSNAFLNCTGLTKVTIPATFGSVSLPSYTSNAAFYGCTSLTEIVFEEGITKLPAYAFVGMYIPEITIPETVTEIGNYAFYNCTKLRKVNLPKNMTTLGNSVFHGCSSLEEAPLGEQITSIGSHAFAGCTALQEIKLPAQLKSISSNAFMNCTGLTKVTIPASFGSVSLPSYTSNAVFYGCTALTEIAFEEGITKIPAYAFVGMSMHEITIPETVTEIGNYAFYNCAKLRKVGLSEGLNKIGNYAFSNCTILKRITLPSTVKTIGTGAFQNCTDLTSVSIPNGVTAMNSYSFYGCSSLKKIVIPGTVEKIANNAFTGVAAVTAGPIGGGYDIEFGWSKTIPEYAFYNMSNLTTVVIPKGVSSLGSRAFALSGLTTISLPSTLKTISNNCFNNCDKLTEIVIPAGTTSIGVEAFYGSDLLAKVTIPDSVTSIGRNAFYRCSSSLVIYCSDGSSAASYADANGIKHQKA